MSPADRAGHRVDPLLVDAGLDDRPGHDRVQQVEVGPARHLGPTPPNTACSSIYEDTTLGGVVTAAHQRRRRLVAAGLDAEHECVAAHRRRAHGRYRGAHQQPGEALAVLVGLDVVAPHHDGVGLSLVVVLAHARRDEPERAVQLLGATARRPHLQRPRRTAALDRFVGERRHDPRADVVTALRRVHGDVRHVGLAGDEHQAAVADDRAATPGDHVVAPAGRRFVQLVVEHLRGPWARGGRRARSPSRRRRGGSSSDRSCAPSARGGGRGCSLARPHSCNAWIRSPRTVEPKLCLMVRSLGAWLARWWAATHPIRWRRTSEPKTLLAGSPLEDRSLTGVHPPRRHASSS